VRKYFIRFAVALLTFSIGAVVSEFSNRLHKLAQWSSSHEQIEAHSRAESSSVAQMPQTLIPKTLSPYDIESFINAHPQANLAELWQRIGIRGLNFAQGWQGDTTLSQFLASCTNCSAETFGYDLDSEPGSEVLLRIEDRLSETCRYLVFKSLGRLGTWRLIGHIDHNFGRYMMPHHLILLSNGRSWLVITQQGQSGTGVALYFDRLFLVEHGALREVMRYTSKGHQSTFTSEPERDFSGRILNCEVRNGVARIEIEFAVTYLREDLSNPSLDAALFTKKQKALFVGKLGRKRFALDATRSDLSQNELEAVYDVDSLTNESFLKYNLEELSRIAKGTDTNRKEWLKRFLNVCKNSTEKRRLSVLLGSK